MAARLDRMSSARAHTGPRVWTGVMALGRAAEQAAARLRAIVARKLSLAPPGAPGRTPTEPSTGVMVRPTRHGYAQAVLRPHPPL